MVLLVLYCHWNQALEDVQLMKHHSFCAMKSAINGSLDHMAVIYAANCRKTHSSNEVFRVRSCDKIHDIDLCKLVGFRV
jgi:hypothetical protein